MQGRETSNGTRLARRVQGPTAASPTYPALERGKGGGAKTAAHQCMSGAAGKVHPRWECLPGPVKREDRPPLRKNDGPRTCRRCRRHRRASRHLELMPSCVAAVLYVVNFATGLPSARTGGDGQGGARSGRRGAARPFGAAPPPFPFLWPCLAGAAPSFLRAPGAGRGTLSRNTCVNDAACRSRCRRSSTLSGCMGHPWRAPSVRA